jgi:hypothetical protein
VSAGSLRGADQLGYAIEDVLRGCELGPGSILVADLGALMALGRLKQAGSGIYPSGGHLRATVLATAAKRVRRAEIGLGLLRRHYPEAVVSGPAGVVT